MLVLTIILVILSLAALAGASYFFSKNLKLRRSLKEHTEKSDKRMYELAILKELGERVGYSLDVENIIDIITGSLGQLIDYSAVAYMLVGPEKIDFKMHLEASVSKKFIEDVRDRMLKSLGALLDRELTIHDIKETVSGAIMVEELEEPVRSFFNIPLVIGDKVVGVLTVAHTKAGLYKEDEMTVLYKITNQASQAVTRLQDVVETEQGKLNAMVESMSEGVVMTDTDYRILVANPAALRAAGIPRKDDINIFDFIDSLSGAFDIRGKLEESVKLEKVMTEKEVFLHDRFYQIVVSPVKNLTTPEGDKLGGVVIFHDITSEKQIEKLRDDFTSMLVHELRSPLDGIKKMIAALSQKSQMEKKKQKEYFDIIFNNSSRMLGLVNDILDVAKFESGTFAINKQEISLKETVSNAVRLFGESAKARKITLTSVLSPSLPEKIKADPERLMQVLSNFISNSLKFTTEGGSITVSSFVHSEGVRVQDEVNLDSLGVLGKDEKALSGLPLGIIVSVADTGVGIKPTDIPELFNKFRQFNIEDSLGSKSRGTGLGLVIAKHIIEAHGGKINLVSERNKGTSFYFNIPL